MPAAHTLSPAVSTHQIAIEPAAAGYSPFRDFVHCRFADAGRRCVWMRSPRPASANLHKFCRATGLDKTATFLPLLPQLRTSPFALADCRVGRDVTTPTPHRAGRANFQHPVPHGRASLTTVYRWTIRAAGRGCRFRRSWNRSHGSRLPRRDSHFCQIRVTFWAYQLSRRKLPDMP